MNKAVYFRKNCADLGVLLIHLNRCDELFDPRLSDRVNIDAYAEKMLAFSLRFEAWHEQALIGLLAAYCNNKDERTAFITNLSVLPHWQGQGIAKHLLITCLDHLNALGFKVVELEVDRRNETAVSLYQKLRFKPVLKNKNPTAILMRLLID